MIVLIPSSGVKLIPLLLIVCLWSVDNSVLFNPTEPSLNVLYKNVSGYAVRSDPSLFSGTLPYTLVTLNDGRPFDFKFTLSVERLSLALLISRYLVSLLTIS